MKTLLLLLSSIMLSMASVIPLGFVPPAATLVQGPSSHATVVGPDGGVIASSNIGGSVVAPTVARLYTLPAPILGYGLPNILSSHGIWIG
ncbi:unnamed protein product [Acanthoscelides obtectus]|uniref:Uncharacterized protein n=2 Tax=Acanthoscelides obtectus TaxID=200917 RepID=A0A9P0PUP2_ACAOB|nr:unnamed protein product [Acanthoscelides obtectus]CAK1672145.1 hypothetical protein AOBTE_LOCUS28677 [Acanthoscelides obtectus]